MQENATILIVDDQPQNIELLEAYLFPDSYKIVTASNGKEALEILLTNQIDLVLLDVMMPNMDGFEVIRRIRIIDGLQQLPIILVTALRETEDRIRGIEAGCDDFISKPVEKNELVSRVRSLLKVKAYNDLKSNYQKELEIEVTKRTEELRNALDKLEKASLDTIFRLSVAAEYKDEETGLHVKRMSLYAEAIARQMGFDEHNARTIRYAAVMHDIGKIGIPDKILLKSGKLDVEEWKIMKNHSIIGAKILKDSDAEFIKVGESIALNHHEKWDGSGYPNALKGTEIPIEARIATITDVFDALLSKRPYKESFSIEKAEEIIKEGSGTHFDPKVVDAFFAIKDEIFSIKTKCDNEEYLKI